MNISTPIGAYIQIVVLKLKTYKTRYSNLILLYPHIIKLIYSTATNAKILKFPTLRNINEISKVHYWKEEGNEWVLRQGEGGSRGGPLKSIQTTPRLWINSTCQCIERQAPTTLYSLYFWFRYNSHWVELLLLFCLNILLTVYICFDISNVKWIELLPLLL